MALNTMFVYIGLVTIGGVTGEGDGFTRPRKTAAVIPFIYLKKTNIFVSRKEYITEK